MRHLKRSAKLGRSSEHRNAMLANLVCSLIKHKRVTTTIHKAKGKEWPLVFLLQPASLFGLREALEGRTRTVDDDDEAEERNCTYVAVTRSTKELIVLKHIAKEGDAPLDFAPLLDGCAKPGDPGAAEGANNVRRRLFEDTDADGLAPQAKCSKRG